MDVVKAFNSELVSLYEIRPPISKKKMVDITKAALKAIKYYKHVVMGVEKFILKCKAEYKVPGLYVVDSIVRQSQHQFGIEKDVFGPRFTANLSATVKQALSCPEEDRQRIVRVLNLWLENGVFSAAVINPLLILCREQGLETDVKNVERLVKGEAADMEIYGKRSGSGPQKSSKFEPQTPPRRSADSQDTIELTSRRGPINNDSPQETMETTTESDTKNIRSVLTERELHAVLKNLGMDTPSYVSDSVLFQQIFAMTNNLLAEREDLNTRTQGNIKNLLSQNFDYSDEEEEEEETESGGDEPSFGDDGTRKQRKSVAATARPITLTRAQIVSSAEALLRDPNILQQIRNLHQQRKVVLAAQQQQMALVPPAMPQSTMPGSLPFSLPPPLLNMASRLPNPGMLLPPPTLPNQMLQGALLSQLPPRFAPHMAPPPFVALSGQQQQQQPVMHNVMPFAVKDQDDRSSSRYDRDDRAGIGGDIDERRMSEEKRTGRGGRRGEERGERRRERSPSSRDRNDRQSSRSSKRSRRSRSRERNSESRSRRNSPSRSSIPMDKAGDKERKKLALPSQNKPGHLLVASRTLWLGRIPVNCSEQEIRMQLAESGDPERVNVIPSRACAYVTMKDRRAAVKIMDKMRTLSWATGQGLKNSQFAQFWDSEKGLSQIPYAQLPEPLDELAEGGHLDVESIPANIRHLYNEFGLLSKAQSSTTNTFQLSAPAVAPILPYANFAFQPTLPGSVTGFFPTPGGFAMPPAMLPPGLPSGTLPGVPIPSAAGQQQQSMPSHGPFAGGSSSGPSRMPGFNPNVGASEQTSPATWNPHRGNGGFRGNNRGNFQPRGGGGGFRGGRGGGGPRFGRGGFGDGQHGGGGGYNQQGGNHEGDGGFRGGRGGFQSDRFGFSSRFRQPSPGDAGGFATSGFPMRPPVFPGGYQDSHGHPGHQHYPDDEKPIHIAVVSSSQQDDSFSGRTEESDREKLYENSRKVSETVADSSGNNDYPPPGDD